MKNRSFDANYYDCTTDRTLGNLNSALSPGKTIELLLNISLNNVESHSELFSVVE